MVHERSVSGDNLSGLMAVGNKRTNLRYSPAVENSILAADCTLGPFLVHHVASAGAPVATFPVTLSVATVHIDFITSNDKNLRPLLPTILRSSLRWSVINRRLFL